MHGSSAANGVIWYSEIAVSTPKVVAVTHKKFETLHVETSKRLFVEIYYDPGAIPQQRLNMRQHKRIEIRKTIVGRHTVLVLKPPMISCGGVNAHRGQLT